MKDLRQRLARAGATTALAGSLLLGGFGATAQEPTQDVVTQLPATINPGLCDEGVAPEPAFDLGLLGPVAGEDGQLPEAEDIRGFQTSPPVLEVEESIDADFDDILDEPHALVIHAGEDEMGTYVACADLGGPVDDNELIVGIRPVNDSGYYGLIVIELDEGTPIIGEDELDIDVYLYQDIGPEGPVGIGMPEDGTPEAPAEGTPAILDDATPATDATPIPPAEASPTGSTPAAVGDEIVIASYDIYFEPAELTIQADTPVVISLPNFGAAPHNFAIDDRNNPDVPNLGIDVDIAPGATETVTIEAPPGEYYFYCNVPGHEQAGMFGTLTVE